MICIYLRRYKSEVTTEGAYKTGLLSSQAGVCNAAVVTPKAIVTGTGSGYPRECAFHMLHANAVPKR